MMPDQGFTGIDAWLQEMKSSRDADKVGMYLIHNGVVRASSRQGDVVTGMDLTYDARVLEAALVDARELPGIVMVRAWLNSGRLEVGDDIMYALVAGDIRPNVISALQSLVGTIKSEVVTEVELGP